VTVHLRLVAGVAEVVIDRPEKRNAMNQAMWIALRDHLHAIESSDVRAIVLRGTGGSFCAGADLSDRIADDPDHVDRFVALAEHTVHALTNLDRPTVALIDGPCIGAGLSLAMACDLRIATPGSLFAIPSLRNGIVYERSLVERLVQIAGHGSAALLLLGGRRVDGAEANTRGLVDLCTPDAAAVVDDITEHLLSARPDGVAHIVDSIRSAASA